MATTNTPAPTTAKAPAKKAAAKAPAKKVEAPASTPAAKKVTEAKAEAPKLERITPSTDPQHQAWQAAKKDLTAVMADLLYDSRRVTPDYAPNREEARAKVGAALKALTEFTESICVK